MFLQLKLLKTRDITKGKGLKYMNTIYLHLRRKRHVIFARRAAADHLRKPNWKPN